MVANLNLKNLDVVSKTKVRYVVTHCMNWIVMCKIEGRLDAESNAGWLKWIMRLLLFGRETANQISKTLEDVWAVKV